MEKVKFAATCVGSSVEAHFSRYEKRCYRDDNEQVTFIYFLNISISYTVTSNEVIIITIRIIIIIIIYKS
jgi:hypothetical protein